MAFKFECLIERFLSSISQCIHWPLVVIYVRLAEILTRPLVSWRKTCQQGMIWSLDFYSIQLHLVQTDHKDMTFMICYLFRTSKGCLCSCPIPHSFLYLSSFWSVLNSRSHYVIWMFQSCFPIQKYLRTSSSRFTFDQISFPMWNARLWSGTWPRVCHRQ